MHALCVYTYIPVFSQAGAVTFIDGLVQDCSNSIANTLELLQSYKKPSMWSVKTYFTWNDK